MKTTLPVLMGLILIAMLAGGCCEIKTAYVPVSSCKEPPPLTMPVLMIDNLAPQATTKDKLHAFKVDFGTLKQTLGQCIVIVDGYRKAEPKAEPKN